MNTIKDLVGEPENVYEKCINSKLEDDIDDLEKKIAGSKETLQHLDIQCEAAQTELDAQLEVDKSISTNWEGEVQAFRKKSEILTTYVEFVNTDEFEIYKLKQDLNVNCHQLRDELMRFVKKKQEIQERWERLNNLAKECAPIKDEVEKLQADEAFKSKHTSLL